jgi:hypothetical protein
MLLSLGPQFAQQAQMVRRILAHPVQVRAHIVNGLPHRPAVARQILMDAAVAVPVPERDVVVLTVGCLFS